MTYEDVFKILKEEMALIREDAPDADEDDDMDTELLDAVRAGKRARGVLARDTSDNEDVPAGEL
jgi:hypothetical protein